MFGTILLLIILIGLIYLILIWNFGYWKQRGVTYPKPLPLLGNLPSAFTQKRHALFDLDDIYKKYKNDEYFVGIFSSRTPQLLITSPELAHRIFVTDFKHFHDNAISIAIDTDSTSSIFNNNPFVLKGEAWKSTRAELTPGLTVHRIKTAYPVTNKICKTMVEYLRKQIRMNPPDGIDAKDLTVRFTSEVVTNCVLGLNADSFTDKPTPILEMVHKLFSQTFMLTIYMFLTSLFPIITRFYKLNFFPMECEVFFKELMQKAIDIRKSQGQQQDRMDFLNYILQLQAKKQLSLAKVTSNITTFLLDGFETTAVVISHCLLLLGRNPEIQAKLRAEIDEHIDKQGDLDFDTLNDLPYLDACIHETIRIFPPGVFSNKLCTEPIQLTNKNGRTLTLKKNDIVVVPTFSFMHDEVYYPDPYKFEPERFSEENGGIKKYRDMGVYYGFGDGPRICIGMRFGLTQTKAAVAEIVKNFNIRINPKTRSDNKLDAKYFISRLDGGIWLDLSDRESRG